MAMTTYQGYFDDQGRFVSLDASFTAVPKHRKAIIVVSDELITDKNELMQTKAERQVQALDALLKANEAVDDEPLGEEFTQFLENNRFNIAREVDL